MPRQPTHCRDSNASRRRCWLENLRLQLELSQEERRDENIIGPRSGRAGGRACGRAGGQAPSGRQLVRAGRFRNLSLLAHRLQRRSYIAHSPHMSRSTAFDSTHCCPIWRESQFPCDAGHSSLCIRTGQRVYISVGDGGPSQDRMRYGTVTSLTVCDAQIAISDALAAAHRAI